MSQWFPSGTKYSMCALRGQGAQQVSEVVDRVSDSKLAGRWNRDFRDRLWLLWYVTERERERASRVDVEFLFRLKVK